MSDPRARLKRIVRVATSCIMLCLGAAFATLVVMAIVQDWVLLRPVVLIVGGAVAISALLALWSWSEKP